MTDLLMALVVPPNGRPEVGDSEPVTVDVGPLEVTFTLDDGSQLVFDRGELSLALAETERRAA